MSRDARYTPPRLGYRPALDGVRAVAIGGVLAFHAGFGLGGALGVTVFFALSGFLITTLLLEERATSGGIDLRAFYLRRVFRLYPALLVALGLTLAVTLWHHPAVDDHMWVAYPAALFYFANLVPVAVVPSALGSIVWTWSLSVEEQFYLLWPALCRRVVRHREGVPARALPGLRHVAIAAAGLTLLSTCLRLFVFNVHPGDPHMYYGTLSRMNGLLIGCLAAVWRQRQVRRDGLTIRTPGAVAALSILTVVALYPFRQRLVWHEPLVAIATCALLLAVIEDGGGFVARLLSARPVVRIGKLSYGIYLYNMLVMSVWAALGFGEPRGPWALAWVAATVAVAELSYRFVERPILARAPRPTARPAPVTPYPTEQRVRAPAR